MAIISPLRGIRYNPERVRDLAEVIAPPYDVVSSQEQEHLYRRSPYNVIRLELGKELPGDDGESNRYTRARTYLEEWLDEGILRVEAAPALYIHRHEFPFGGRRLSRLGLVAGLRLEDWSAGVVLPHEDTLPKPKLDRLELMRTCQCNFSPIMALYEDSRIRQRLEEYVRTHWAEVVAAEENGQEHRLWLLNDPELVSWIRQRLATKLVFIADGHHRYETALQNRREIEARLGPLPPQHPANYVLTTLFDFGDPGLVILPTHRLVREVEEDRLANLPRALGQVFDVQTRPLAAKGDDSELTSLLGRMRERSSVAHCFGLYGPERAHLHLLSLPHNQASRLQLVDRGSDAYRQLDVSILHHFILSKLLGVDEAKVASESYVGYTRDENAAMAAVREGQYQLAFFLNPTLPQQVRDVALAGDRMPQKSTYFYPKLPTGLIIANLRDQVAQLGG